MLHYSEGSFFMKVFRIIWDSNVYLRAVISASTSLGSQECVKVKGRVKPKSEGRVKPSVSLKLIRRNCCIKIEKECKMKSLGTWK